VNSKYECGQIKSLRPALDCPVMARLFVESPVRIELTTF
jgi:hypothetical protein